jgi:hypothetical protein
MEKHRLRVLETKVLRKIFGPKREEEEGDGGACATRGGEERYRVLVGKPEITDHFEDLNVDWRTILKWIFKKWGGGRGMD